MIFWLKFQLGRDSRLDIRASFVIAGVRCLERPRMTGGAAAEETCEKLQTSRTIVSRYTSCFQRPAWNVLDRIGHRIQFCAGLLTDTSNERSIEYFSAL